jgi:hypothetical protein
MLSQYAARIPETDRIALDDLRELLALFNKEANESRVYLEENKEDMTQVRCCSYCYTPSFEFYLREGN